MTYFDKHFFICTNKRDDGSQCCNERGDMDTIFKYAKNKVTEMGLAGKGKVRVNKAGCLDRCAEGPVAVVYPEGVWYTFIDQEDIDEIIDSHLANNQIVERLKLED